MVVFFFHLPFTLPAFYDNVSIQAEIPCFHQSGLVDFFQGSIGGAVWFEMTMVWMAFGASVKRHPRNSYTVRVSGS